MISNAQKSEYIYQNNQPEHHHNYLLNPLIKLLDRVKNSTNSENLRILDLGCGNGSLSEGLKIEKFSFAGRIPFLWKSMLCIYTTNLLNKFTD